MGSYKECRREMNMQLLELVQTSFGAKGICYNNNGAKH